MNCMGVLKSSRSRAWRSVRTLRSFTDATARDHTFMRLGNGPHPVIFIGGFDSAEKLKSLAEITAFYCGSVIVAAPPKPDAPITDPRDALWYLSGAGLSIADVLDTIGEPHAHVVGHSLGAHIAAAAAIHPLLVPRISSLSIIDTPLTSPTRIANAAALAAARAELLSSTAHPLDKAATLARIANDDLLTLPSEADAAAVPVALSGLPARAWRAAVVAPSNSLTPTLPATSHDDAAATGAPAWPMYPLVTTSAAPTVAAGGRGATLPIPDLAAATAAPMCILLPQAQAGGAGGKDKDGGKDEKADKGDAAKQNQPAAQQQQGGEGKKGKEQKQQQQQGKEQGKGGKKEKMDDVIAAHYERFNVASAQRIPTANRFILDDRTATEAAGRAVSSFVDQYDLYKQVEAVWSTAKKAVM